MRAVPGGNGISGISRIEELDSDVCSDGGGFERTGDLWLTLLMQLTNRGDISGITSRPTSSDLISQTPPQRRKLTKK